LQTPKELIMTDTIHPHPRARELHTLLLSRGIGLWCSAFGIVEQINLTLMNEAMHLNRLFGGQV
jgi:hypothetical protein